MRMSVSGAPAALSGLAALALVVSACSSPASDEGAAADGICRGQIAVMAPITSGAGQVGQEQVNFAHLAVDDINAERGSEYSVVEFDTRLDAAAAAEQAELLAADSATIAVVGPSSSQEVAAVAATFAEAGLAFVSGAATRPDLTDGSNPGFFRVVPTDAAQATTIADAIAGDLDAQRVVILEEQTDYGIGLATAVAQELTAAGVQVDVVAVEQDVDSFDAVVSGIPADTDVVLVTFQVGAKTQVVAEQLRSAGSQAVMFGSESSYWPDFTMPGSYVSALSPDITGIPEADGVIDRYTAAHGSFGPYGAPTYVAMQAVLDAAQRACESSGSSADRAAVLTELPNTVITGSILGRDIAFDARGDITNPEFAILTIDDTGAFVNVP